MVVCSDMLINSRAAHQQTVKAEKSHYTKQPIGSDAQLPARPINPVN